MTPPDVTLDTTDTPGDAMLLAVDNGLEQYNHAVAPLKEVRSLASFATDASGTVVGARWGAPGASAANCSNSGWPRNTAATVWARDC